MSESDDEKDDNNALPLESIDDLFLHVMYHARFHPDEKVELPSGKVISGREAQAFIAAFHQSDLDFGPKGDPYDALDLHAVERDGYSPLSSANDQWTGDPATDRELLRQRAMEAIRRVEMPDQLPNPVYISSRPRNPFIRMYRWLRDLRRR